MDRWEKERRERTKVEFLTGTARKSATSAEATATTVSEGRKKTKWDVSSSATTSVKLGSSAAASSHSGASGSNAAAKPTVISAFGSIKRK